MRIEGGGAIVEIDRSIFDYDLIRAQIEQRLQGRRTVLLRPPRTRLIGRAVAIDDEMQPELVNLEIAQRNMRSEQAQDAHADAQAVDLGVRRFAGVLRAMNHNSVCFCFEIKKTPMKGSNLRAAAGNGFNLSDEALANQILECGRAGNKVGCDCREDEQNRGRRQGERQVAKEKAAQTRALAARNGLGRGRLIRGDRRGAAIGHRFASVFAAGAAPELAIGFAAGLEFWIAPDSSDGSRTSTSPCSRRLSSHASKRTFTCFSSRIS